MINRERKKMNNSKRIKRKKIEAHPRFVLCLKQKLFKLHKYNKKSNNNKIFFKSKANK